MTASPMPRAKRVAPPTVKPLLQAGIRYEAVHWGRRRGLPHDGGYIEAFDASGKSLWLAEVYAVSYQPGLETDVQDLFIRQIEAGAPGQLLITDERGRQHAFDLSRQAGAAPAGGPSASRPPPAEVLPLEWRGVRYSAGHTGLRGKVPGGGWVQAVDIASGKQLWQTTVYAQHYDPDAPIFMPRYIRSLRLAADQQALEIEDESGARYRLELGSRQVRQIGGPAERAEASSLPTLPKPPAP